MIGTVVPSFQKMETLKKFSMPLLKPDQVHYECLSGKYVLPGSPFFLLLEQVTVNHSRSAVQTVRMGG